MNKDKYQKELEKEKKKLDRLIEEALRRGERITEEKAVMEQNRKVDELVVKVQREKGNNKK